MLRTRILTALVLLPLAWLLLFRADLQVFMWVAALLLLVGSWEFHRLAALPTWMGAGIVLEVQVALFVVLVASWSQWTANPIPPFQLACLAWLVMFVQLWLYRPGRTPDRVYRIRSTLNAFGVITFGWMALCWLRAEPSGQWWLLALLLVIFAADIGAYFSGRAFGQRKLAPSISPGKTRAGLYGGLLAATAVGVLLALCLPVLDAAPLPLALLAAVTALVSVGGDLFISMHKRSVGLKDCGRIFPGHGGVLDRFDSLLAGAPFFALGKLLAGL
jgi:phosphatidate cytidylyltransferase